MSHEQMADREYARNVGFDQQDRAWILSDRDVWYPNPFYHGLRMPYPEDDSAHDFIEEHGIEAWRALPRPGDTAIAAMTTASACPLEAVFRGRSDEVPGPVLDRARDGHLISVSVAPYDHIDHTRGSLVDALARALIPGAGDGPVAGRIAGQALFQQWANTAYPGSPADLTEVTAPQPPLDAKPWRLADDVETYGMHAGWWIVVDGSDEFELDATPRASCADAKAVADHLNDEDPHPEWYRHWWLIPDPDAAAAMVTAAVTQAPVLAPGAGA